jgi:thiamine pyrophosphate-dependent acetolactate synthase large subunit-like protein
VTTAKGITAGQLLARVLRARGIDAVYGQPRPGIAVVEVDAAVAPLLAAAHRRVHRQPAAVLDADGLHLGDGPAVVVGDAGALAGAVSAGSLALDLDLAGPAPDVAPPARTPADRWVEPGAGIVEAIGAAASPAALVGPGVVDLDAVPGLHALATALSIGVLNTWGAKGVFDWRSRHHLATVGLQELDFQLGGLAEADLILTSGLDELESPTDRWRLAPSLGLDPRSLGPLAQMVTRQRVELEVPPLRTGLAAVTQEGWSATGTPLAPTRVTMHYGQVFGSGGLVAADPGTCGYWVARTFSTTELGSAVVPAERRPGFAAACALVARLRRPARPVLAVMDDEAPARPVLDAARRLGVPVPIEVWEQGGPGLDADAHLARLRAMATSEVTVVERIATDPSQLDRMIGVAGPVIAWSST